MDYLCVNIMAFLSIFTFYIPLFLSGIPQYQRAVRLQHRVDMNFNIVDSTNTSFVLKCSMSDSQIRNVYNNNGICLDLQFSSGNCNQTFVSLVAQDIFYVRQNKIFRDDISNRQLGIPATFNLGFLRSSCDRDWLYDPTKDFFIDNSRTYLATNTTIFSKYKIKFVNKKGYVPAYHSSSSSGSRNWEYKNINKYQPIVFICIFGSGFGILVISSVLAIVTVPLAIYNSICRSQTNRFHHPNNQVELNPVAYNPYNANNAVNNNHQIVQPPNHSDNHPPQLNQYGERIHYPIAYNWGGNRNVNQN